MEEGGRVDVVGVWGGRTPLVETHTISEEWSNMRIWKGRVSS